MSNSIFKHYSGDDVEDMIYQLESIFRIELPSIEINKLKTFGDFTDYIIEKCGDNHNNDCTSQQAFYKLREAISVSLHLNKNELYPSTLLTDILPRKGRWKEIKKLEQAIGFRLYVLKPKDYTIGWTSAVFTAMIVAFINLIFGLTIFSIIIGVYLLVNKYGNDLRYTNLGQVAKEMAKKNYFQSRRNPSTFNKYEVENLIRDIICEGIDIPKSILTKDAPLQ